MHKLCLFVVLVTALAIASCQAPLSLNRQAVNLALTVSYTSPHLPTTATQARLLLPTATYVQLTLKNIEGKATLYTQSISSASNAVFSLTGIIPGEYTVTGQAFADATLTTSLFSNSITTTISTSTAALSLYLVPTSSTSITASTPVVGTLAANTSSTFVYNPAAISDSLTLVGLPSGISYYLQKSDGTTVADNSGTIAANATDGTLLLTLYNATANAVSYNFSLIDSSVNLGLPQWAVTTTSSQDISDLSAVAVDSTGNVLAAGSMNNTNPFNMGDDATGTSGPDGGINPFLLKMSSTGHVLWEASGGAATNATLFNGVATDASNNVYAAGAAASAGTLTFGSVTTTAIDGAGSILVKYNSSGTAQWVISSSLSTGGDRFSGVAADASGNSWAVGYNRSPPPATIRYGSGSVTGTINGTAAWQLVIAKFDTSGTTQWISSTHQGSTASFYNAVAVDSADNSYAAGIIEGTSSFLLGNSSQSLPVVGTAGANAVLAKYGPTGLVLWTACPPSGGLATAYNGVAVDDSGNVIAVGTLAGGGAQNFGNGQSLTGGDSNTADTNAVIVKYDTNGNTLWARTVNFAAGISSFNSVSFDSLGNSYAVGTVTAPGTYSFGSQTITVPTIGGTGNALVIVKYNSSGTEQWVETLKSGSNASEYKGVVADKTNGNVYAVGDISASALFDLGNGVTTTGAAGTGYTNALVVQYH